ncbi:MAG: 5-(carboxyamino)imidazole ribonucleotide synthase [Tropheryma whipplei]|nr:5-(carboxyamino)imidazole ribonucleotide synthase [Tropheryma whipplei]
MLSIARIASPAQYNLRLMFERLSCSVGVIGGGQLARMMIAPAQALGVDLKVFADTPDSSAALAATAFGSPENGAAVLEFAQTVDIVTFEHELVPADVLQLLDERGIEMLPRPRALRYAQDKLALRRYLDEISVNQPAWAEVRSEEDLERFISEHGGCAVVKTGGYDGRGVQVVTLSSEIDTCRNGGFLAEERIDFVCEVSQLVARSSIGEICVWPLTQTIQENGICVQTITPALGLSGGNALNQLTTFHDGRTRTPHAPLHSELITKLQDSAKTIALDIARGLNVVGVMAVEMFITQDGKLLVNELAMRPHNSGHWSMAASITDQFEQHLRAVLGLPLGATDMSHNCAIMVNIFNSISPAQYREVMTHWPDAKLHIYKKQPRPGRKIGHVVFAGEDLQQLAIAAEECRQLLRESHAV